MIDLDAIRLTVVKGLRDYLGIPVIRSNQTGEPPNYPYLSYTIINPARDNGGTWGKYDDGKDRKPITQTWSVTVQSDNASEALENIMKARDWLDHIGTVCLNDNRIIVQSLTGISNRDNMIMIEYEYRNGFDVVFWLLNETDNVDSETGYIETVIVDDKEIEPQESIDELNKRLEKRLDGVS